LRIDVYFHAGDDVTSALSQLLKNQGTIMSDLQTLNDKLDAIGKATGDYIAGRDKIDADKDAALAAAIAQHVTDQATLDALQPAIDAANAKADAELALLTPPAVTPPADAPAP